jgi:hypothetical protein
VLCKTYVSRKEQRDLLWMLLTNDVENVVEDANELV